MTTEPLELQCCQEPEDHVELFADARLLAARDAVVSIRAFEGENKAYVELNAEDTLRAVMCLLGAWAAHCRSPDDAARIGAQVRMLLNGAS